MSAAAVRILVTDMTTQFTLFNFLRHRFRRSFTAAGVKRLYTRVLVMNFKIRCSTAPYTFTT